MDNFPIYLDHDLKSEVERLEAVYRDQGLQIFQYACISDWQTPTDEPARSILFRCVTPDGREGPRPDGKLCGCLTEIKGEHYPTGPRVAWRDEWTEAIRLDERIPWTVGEIRPESLIAFAEWQQEFRNYFREEMLIPLSRAPRR